MRSILRIVLGSLATVGACVWLVAGASAASPDAMRLYVFSSGWLTLDKSGLQTGATEFWLLGLVASVLDLFVRQPRSTMAPARRLWLAIIIVVETWIPLSPFVSCR